MTEQIVRTATALAIPTGAVLSRETLVSVMARWSVAYAKAATVETIAVYYEALSDFRDDEAEEGIRACVKSESYPPPPATVRRYCLDARYRRLDREEAARDRAEFESWKRGRADDEAARVRREATIASWTSGPTTSAAEAVERLVVRRESSLWFTPCASTSGALHLVPKYPYSADFYAGRSKDLEEAAAQVFVGPVVVVGAEA